MFLLPQTFPSKIHFVHIFSKRHTHIIVITNLTIMSNSKHFFFCFFLGLSSTYKQINRSKSKIKILLSSRFSLKIIIFLFLFLCENLDYLLQIRLRFFLIFLFHFRQNRLNNLFWNLIRVSFSANQFKLIRYT